MAGEPIGILLLSGAHDRAHAALSLAVAAGALGRAVTVFATGAGCRALLADWSVLAEVGRDAVIRRRGVSGFGELRDAARELGVTMIACESGLKAEALEDQPLAEGVTVGGMAALIERSAGGPIVSF